MVFEKFISQSIINSSMEMISILIPVYKESNLFETLLNQLIKDPYENKEIITVIDEPTKNSLGLVEKYKNQVKFILNKKRKGKVNALNEAAKLAKGDIFLFIDSDSVISKKSKNFIETVAEKMKNIDMLDIRKNSFRDSLISRLTTYEFLGSTLYGWLLSKIKKCVAVCGIAFAVKRSFFDEVGGFKNVISEDLEMGMQTLIRNKHYDFSNDLEVFSKSAENWKSWFIQRKRWSLGAGYHLKRHWKTFFKTAFKHPSLFIILLYFGWPTIMSALVLFLVNSFFDQVLMLLLFSLSLKFTFLTPLVLFVGLYLVFIKNIFLFFATYFISATIFYVIARKFKYEYNHLEFALYYLIYSPIFSCIFFYYLFKSLISTEPVALENWRIK